MDANINTGNKGQKATEVIQNQWESETNTNAWWQTF